MHPRETEIFIAILLTSGIIGIIIICFIVAVIKNHKRLLNLQRQHLIAEVNALEVERKRIVSDLHDELGPLLAVVKFQITNLGTTLKKDIELVDKASNHLDAVILRIREICNHILPDVLTRKGLFTAINKFIEEMEPRTSTDIIFTCRPGQVSPQVELHVYRMIQEMTNNALKYSGATRLMIDINISNQMLALKVSDNGKGFDTTSVVNDSAGLGIKNIFGRTRMLNGIMCLTSEPGKGTTYKIEIPIQCNEPQNTIDDRR
jgi:signal transduction histidine kinase